MALFEAKNIDKNFGEHTALKNVSLSIPKGSIYGLLGPNGAGKTTMLRIMNQIMIPDKGELLLHGKKIKPDDCSQIGYLPEERGLYKKMKVGEQALYFAQLKGLPKKEAQKRTDYWFNKFNINSWRNRKVEELSKGMQQKIQFIITILHRPPFLIFDEPFTGFDPVNTNMLKEEIIRLKNEGATIILSTHNMNSVEELCDHITLISNARSIIEGPIDQIKEKYKSNIYEINYWGDPNEASKLIPENLQLIKKEKNNNGWHVQIKIPEKDAVKQLMNKFIDKTHVISFREVIPSMNDIFLKLVEEENINHE